MKKGKKEKREKKSLKDRIKLGSIAIPSCVAQQVYKFFALAVIVFLGGVFFCVIAFSWVVLMCMISLAGVLAFLGWIRLYTISHRGFSKIAGRCERVEHTVLSHIRNMSRTPKRYLIRSDGKLYAIPFNKYNPVIQEGDSVVIFVKPNEEAFLWNGVYTPTTIYGYEIQYIED